MGIMADQIVFRMDSLDLNIDGKKLCKKCKKLMDKGPNGIMQCPEHGEEPEEMEDKADLVRYDTLWSLSPIDLAEAEYLGYVKKFTKDANGFLRGIAPVTNIGVFSYVMDTGAIRRELRLPEEVFHPDSIASLKMVPLTNDHPKDGVTPETAKKLQVGTIGDGINYDAYKIYAPICVTASDAITQMEDGKRALSCGYTCKLEDKSGTWMGVQYDAIQREIRYNHVAIVDKGRAGDSAVMKMDGVIQGQLFRIDSPTLTPKKDSPMKKITIDSVEVEVPESVAAHLDRMEKKHADAETKHKNDLAAIQAKADAETQRADQLKAQVDGIPATVSAAIKAHADVVAKASALKVAIKDDMSDADIQKAIVMQAFPKADSAKLSEPAYLSAMLDAAESLLSAEPKHDVAPNAGLGKINQDDNKDGCGGSGKKLSDAQAAYNKRMGIAK